MLQLREYQLKTINEIYTELKVGKKRVIAASCTGSGKTVVFCKIVSDAVNKGRRVLIVVDDSPLISQTLDKLDKFGLRAGVIKFGYKPDYSFPVQVASIDSLIRRELPPADIIIIDECHLSYSKKYSQVFSHYEGEIFLGFSATPERMKKSESLLNRWETLVRGLTIQEAIAIGANVPMVVYSIKRDRLGLRKIKTTAGDYTQSQLGLAMQDPALIKLAVDEWLKRGEGRPTIAFCVTIEHSKKLCQAFLDAGIPADNIDGTHNEVQRTDKYEALREGKIKILCSVNVLSVGFDEPCVSCILSCRPTKSVLIWIQQVGRGLRLAEGKEDCIILDQAENTFNLIHPMEYEPSGLSEPREFKGEAPVKECPSCEAIINNFAQVCPHCGFAFPKKEKGKGYEEMIEILPQLKNPKLIKQREDYQRLIKTAVARDWSPGWANYKFKNKYGCYPSAPIKRHCLFDAFSPEAYQIYREYLEKIAWKNNKDQKWVTTQLIAEFGKITVSTPTPEL